MSYKPNPPPAPSTSIHTLPSASVLELRGRDAAAFLQRQTMNDVRALDRDLSWQWNGVLSAKGRVQSLFALLRVDAEHYWALQWHRSAEPLRELLQRYVLRSKVELGARASLRALIVGAKTGSESLLRADAQTSASPDGPSAPRLSLGANDGGGVLLDFSADADQRRLWLGECSEAGDDDPTAVAQWHLADLRAGLPWLGDDALDAYTPQMLGLDRLGAFSLGKGCYPGQEIVARTHYLGQAKRGLLRVSAARPLQAGEAIAYDDRTLGTVIDAVSADHVHEALAVATLPPPEGPLLTVDGTVLTVLPLLDGLARSGRV